ncbi:TPA: YrzI family small protein, partial [Bacillus cereus]
MKFKAFFLTITIQKR